MGLFKEGGVKVAKKTGGWPLYTLVEEEQLSKDTKKLRFKIPVLLLGRIHSHPFRSVQTVLEHVKLYNKFVFFCSEILYFNLCAFCRSRLCLTCPPGQRGVQAGSGAPRHVPRRNQRRAGGERS